MFAWAEHEGAFLEWRGVPRLGDGIRHRLPFCQSNDLQACLERVLSHVVRKPPGVLGHRIAGRVRHQSREHHKAG